MKQLLRDADLPLRPCGAIGQRASDHKYLWSEDGTHQTGYQVIMHLDPSMSHDQEANARLAHLSDKLKETCGDTADVNGHDIVLTVKFMGGRDVQNYWKMQSDLKKVWRDEYVIPAINERLQRWNDSLSPDHAAPHAEAAPDTEAFRNNVRIVRGENNETSALWNKMHHAFEEHNKPLNRIPGYMLVGEHLPFRLEKQKDIIGTVDAVAKRLDNFAEKIPQVQVEPLMHTCQRTLV